MEPYAKHRFKKVTDKELEVIDDALNNLMRKFTIVFATSESCVYKIMNYILDNDKLDKRYIKTLDGAAIECYFDVKANPKYNHIQMQEQLDHGVLSDVNGKLLIIPSMSCTWNKELVFYFYNELRYAGCLGIIFHSGQNGMNFGKVLLEETTLDVIQFPVAIYNKRRQVEDDEW